MQPFVANLKNELFKLSRRKKYIVFLILGALVCVGSALRVLAADLILDEALPRELLVGGLTGENLLFLLLLFLPLMALMGCCDLFAGETADHTLRFSLMRPIGKGKLFFSKAAAVWIVCLFDLIVLLAVSSLVQGVSGGGGAAVHRVSPVAQPLGGGDPPLPCPADPDRDFSGLRPGVRLPGLPAL